MKWRWCVRDRGGHAQVEEGGLRESLDFGWELTTDRKSGGSSGDGTGGDRRRQARPQGSGQWHATVGSNVVDRLEICTCTFKQLLLLHLIGACRLLNHSLAHNTFARRRISWRFNKCNGRTVLIRCAQDHAIRLDAAKLCRLQVAHDQHGLSLEVLLGRIVSADARRDLPRLLLTNVDFLHPKLLGVRVLPRLDDTANAHIEL
mmetsp:Transcript_626/g.1213  ORF Transcript_626/g.1213 Transcript_626/m.1213 type:complete len:203 (+) Transcript_626:197-805(+)